jgi:hypothetical protein
MEEMDLRMPDTETEDSDFEVVALKNLKKRMYVKKEIYKPLTVVSPYTLTFRVYGGPQVTVEYRNTYERYFACHLINSLNGEIYRIKNLKGYADHLETVVRNLEIDRLREIIMKCTKIFSVEIDAFENSWKLCNLLPKTIPLEIVRCILMVHDTRITRDNISNRHTNTLERLVEQHRSRLTFFHKKTVTA